MFYFGFEIFWHKNIISSHYAPLTATCNNAAEQTDGKRAANCMNEGNYTEII